MNTEDLRATAKAYARDQDPGDFDNADDRVEEGYEAGFSAALAEVRKTLTEEFAGHHAELNMRPWPKEWSAQKIGMVGAYLTEVEFIWDKLTGLGYADRRPFRED